MFAACENCGERFHMRPGTTAWTCPACGHEHGTATMQDLGEEQPPQRPAEQLPAEQLPARHAAPTGPAPKRPPTRGRLAAIAAVGIASVLVIAFALSSFGAGANGAVSPSASGAFSPSGSSSAVEMLCLHLRDLQTLREDALTGLAAKLSDDATAVQAEGTQTLAEAVQRMQVAVLAYRDALAAQGDTTQAGIKMYKALGDLPC
jgi:predicted  nucleic acid-binding Zn-ribbon protein